MREMSDDFSVSGTPVEVPADELNDPQALIDRMMAEQLRVDDPWIWALLDPERIWALLDPDQR